MLIAPKTFNKGALPIEDNMDGYVEGANYEDYAKGANMDGYVEGTNYEGWKLKVRYKGCSYFVI